MPNCVCSETATANLLNGTADIHTIQSECVTSNNVIHRDIADFNTLSVILALETGIVVQKKALVLIEAKQIQTSSIRYARYSRLEWLVTYSKK